MPGRRLNTVDIRKLLTQIRDNNSDRALAKETGLDRRTIHRYRQWANEHQLFAKALPPLEDLQALKEKTLSDPLPPQNHSSVEPYRDIVLQLRQENVKSRALFQRLTERGYQGSYASVYRFVCALEPKTPDVCVRVETAPGEEAQVDFGQVACLPDPETGALHKVYAFVMTLCWSRHQYVEFVTDQKVETWLALHVRAFAFFGGVVARITCDNLKAAILKAAWNDPLVNFDYAQCAEHYGFRIAPCRPRTPQHKGKVERGVGYVKDNFWAGRGLTDLAKANRLVRDWCLTEAGHRLHGTTKQRPLQRFEQTEKTRLLPLPHAPFDMAVSKDVLLHRDCYVTFEGSYYSAPCRLVGQTLRIRAGLTCIRLYDSDHHLVATHDRAKRPGERHTHPDHLPQEKRAGLYQTPEDTREQAAALGKATQEIVESLLADPILDRSRTAARLVRLVKRYPRARVEAACRRALFFGDPCYDTVKRILYKGLDQVPEIPAALFVDTSATLTFARSAEEIFGGVPGGLTWN